MTLNIKLNVSHLDNSLNVSLKIKKNLKLKSEFPEVFCLERLTLSYVATVAKNAKIIIILYEICLSPSIRTC